MDEGRKLARHLAQIRYEDLPKEVVEKAKEVTLDQLGVQLAASTKPWSKVVYRYVRDLGGRRESTIVNYGDKIDAGNAAFANGSFGHGFEMDDSHRASATHPGCVVVPATLAMAERELASGRDYILALVLGFDVMARIGLAMAPSMIRRGHHPTCSTGTFGAAAIAGKLMGLDEERMLHALSIAGSHSSGLMEWTQGGGHLKRMYGGIAAYGGIRSALLAQGGMSGPATVLEGELGFCRAFSDGCRLEEITQDLGRDFKIMDVHYKIYCQDGFIQPMTEALERIARRRPIAADEVAEVVVGTHQFALRITDTIKEPRDITGAQFSAPFSLALFLVKGGAGFDDYTEESLSDPRILELAKRVRLEVDEDMEKQFLTTRGARVKVRLKDGSVHEELVPMLHRMSGQEFEQKFLRLATVVLSRERAERVLEEVRGLDNLRQVSTLAALLAQ